VGTALPAHKGSQDLPRRKSDLPFGSQFSPKQIDLPELLRIAKDHEGDQPGMTEAIRQAFFGFHAGGDLRQQMELAKNPVLCLREYRLLTEDTHQLTQVGEELLALTDKPDELHKRLAKHMLLELRGLDLVNAILDMQAAKAKVTLESISAWLLETRDLYVPPSSTHISTFNAWLCKAGVLKGLYTVDEDRLQEIIGVSVQEVEELADLTEEQRTFLRALGNLPHFGPILSNKVAQYAQELYGVKFSTKSLPSQVLTPLEEAGYIVKTKTTGGRGAKPFVIETTPKFKKEFIESVLDAIEQSTGFDYRRLYRQSLDEILEELKSKSKNVRGRALEALAIFFMRLLDLQLVAWRLRAKSTGWAEVDIVVEGTRFIFSRWQIQCKHTPRSAVRLDDVAKEVGLAQALNSNVVMVVSTGRFTEDARQFARFMMEKTNLQIILLDQRDLATLESQPTDIVVILRREAENAMQLKKHQLEILGT